MTDAAAWVVEQSGTPTAARTSCAGCPLDDRYCPRCPVERGTVPELADVARFHLELLARCERYGMLPRSGGLLDQDDVTMRILDIVAVARAEEDEKKRKFESAGAAAWKTAGRR